MPLSSQLVHWRLQETARKFRWSRSARFLLGGAALSLLFLVLFLTLDAWVHFGPAGRWSGFAFTTVALATGLALSWRAWRPEISEASMARRIEQASGTGGNVLISAVQFDRSLPADSPLRAALFSEMNDPFPGVRWEAVFDLRRLRRLGYTLGAVCLVIFAWAAVKPKSFANSAARIFLPASNIAPLTRTKIEGVIPGNDTVTHGREVALAATLAGEVPKTAWVYYREQGSSWQKALMQHEAGRPEFSFTWNEVKQPYEYYIAAGDAQSPTYAIQVRPKTAIKTRTAEIQPPAYTHLPKQTVSDFSVLQNVTPGSKVSVAMEFNNAVSTMKAIDDQGNNVSVTGGKISVRSEGVPDGQVPEPLEAGKVSDTRWTVAAPITANRTVKLEFQDALGATDQSVLQISVQPDEPPKVVVSEPVEGRELTAAKGARLAVKFFATDNFGLGSVALYQSSNDKEDAKLIQEWTAASGQKSFEATAQVALAPLADEDRVTYRLIAKDQNDVTGPGVTISRPIVVSLVTAQKVEQQMADAANKLQQGVEALIKLQQANLDATRAAALRKGAGDITPLVERQVQIGDTAAKLASTAETLSPDVRRELTELSQKEMKDATIALRNAGVATAEPRAKFLTSAIQLETLILARLQGVPANAEDDAKKAAIAEVISGVEDLLKKEREIMRRTKANGEAEAAKLSDEQDKLADKSNSVKRSVDADSKNASIGDPDFRKRLGMVATMFGELKVYEDMVASAESLQSKKLGPAGETEQHAVNSLSKMVELLNQWQLAEAEKAADDLKKDAEQLQQNLEKLAAIQRDIVEKSKEMARKNEYRAEDFATAKEIQEQKDLMKEVVEQMTTDLQAFPEMKAGNEMKSELMSIFEDVDQTDKQDIAEGKLKANTIAVQKEQGILDAITQAEKIAADMEMWLPHKSDTTKWQQENFDTAEMPEIPNLPLADAMEDLVGNLLDKQQDLDNTDAASNQAMAMNPANGWDVLDGQLPGFGAQGRSGNTAPKHNEQMGRSSGGREGQSDGEMAGNEASNLKGDTPDARRTKDPMQQGQVKDDGGIGSTKATGGGKAGGFSDRNGMDGDAPVRAVKAPKTETQNAKAVQQALLAEKTAKQAAQAKLLYLKNGEGLQQVAQLMDDSAVAMKEGRMKDAQSLHQRVIRRLQELKSGAAGSEVMSVSTGDATGRDKQLLGGNEGEAPAQYKDQVADYYRSLVEEK